jgi:hypothetical protein
VDGATGPTGANGTDGATGPTGINGVGGATGPAGLNGVDGATGPTGFDGANGPTGPTGIDGVDGPTGPTGQVGSIGPTGPTGINGSDGATGPTGANGTTGATGLTGGVGTIAGTTNRMLVNGATGAVSAGSNITLSTPQNTNTGAAIQYNRLGLGRVPHSTIPLAIDDTRIVWDGGFSQRGVFIGSATTGNATTNGGSSVCIGHNAGSSLSNTSQRTVLIGIDTSSVSTVPTDLTNILCESSSRSEVAFNTIVGSRTLNNYGQSFNVSVGIEAGLRLSGGRNVYVGNEAGIGATGHGDLSNVFIGYRSGAQVQSSSNSNIFLGNNSGQTNIDANQLIISNTSTTNPLFFGNFSTSLLTINGNLTATTGVVTNNAALPLASTTGFLYIPTCPGPPTANPPATQPNTVPIVHDTVNNRLYIYNTSSSQWVYSAF